MTPAERRKVFVRAVAEATCEEVCRPDLETNRCIVAAPLALDALLDAIEKIDGPDLRAMIERGVVSLWVPGGAYRPALHEGPA